MPSDWVAPPVHQFLGLGPSATGSGPGWRMSSQFVARCVLCDHLMPLDPRTSESCECGALHKDEIGRFGSSLGDDQIPIYLVRR